MLNSVVAKTAPHLFQANNTFLNRLVSSSVSHGARPFSVAYNVRSKFEDAYQKKMASQKNTPQKAYVLMNN